MDSVEKRKNRFIGVVAALCGIYLVYGMGISLMDRYTVATLTERTKTACVGRFLVDLPVSMDVSYGQTLVNGLGISTQEETRQAFEKRISARQEEINAGLNDLGKKNLESLENYTNNGFSGKIFAYGRNITKGQEHGKPREWVSIKLEGYVHSNGTSFNFRADGYDPALMGNLRKLIDRLRLVSSDTIPSAAGFCFGPGMFVDPLPADAGEGIVMFAGFRDHPDLALALNTLAGTQPDTEGRLERDTRVDDDMPLWQRALMTKLRKDKRTINGIEGDEVAEKWTELNFVDTFGFDWEVNGTTDNVFLPFMHLEMSSGHAVNAGARPVKSYLGEEALVQLWDKISSSIRVRPTSAASPPQREAPPGTRLGDSAAAGDICPATGWWQCKDGGNGSDVAGGRHQFLRQGQRMPQALLLQPQTWWDKLRGARSSFQTDRPSDWTLVDRRSRSRMAPAVPLAPAALSAELHATHGPDRPGTPASIGSVVDAGATCPASGWWRCEDADALDGTRWFARGELLPLATFHLPRSRLRIGSGQSDGFQRRSRWKLVRAVPDQDDESAAP